MGSFWTEFGWDVNSLSSANRVSCVPSFRYKKTVRELINKMRDGKVVGPSG